MKQKKKKKKSLKTRQRKEETREERKLIDDERGRGVFPGEREDYQRVSWGCRAPLIIFQSTRQLISVLAAGLSGSDPPQCFCPSE